MRGRKNSWGKKRQRLFWRLGLEGVMRNSLIFLIFLAPFMAPFVDLQADAAPAGPLIKHLSSLLKWTRSSPKSQSQTDENVLLFENGYLVETVVEGNELGVIPHSIRVSEDGELFAVDALNSKIVRITPPLSQCFTMPLKNKKVQQEVTGDPSQDTPKQARKLNGEMLHTFLALCHPFLSQKVESSCRSGKKKRKTENTLDKLDELIEVIKTQGEREELVKQDMRGKKLSEVLVILKEMEFLGYLTNTEMTML
ncbi:hypothetical protein GIB67_003737, partial [Kingdonia uniflora]